MISVVCRCCYTPFYVCQSCWRGQAYCSDTCRLSASRASHRKAQQRYRQTEKGKRAHRLSENHRRHRQKADQKNMDDPSSTPALSVYKMASKNKTEVSLPAANPHFCHFCGRPGVVVEKFPRRHYGKCDYSVCLQ